MTINPGSFVTLNVGYKSSQYFVRELLIMDRITENYLKEFLKSQQLLDENINLSRKFEYFSAYCAVSEQYNDSYNLSDIIIGGGDDCGIDGIAIIINGLMIINKDELKDIIDNGQKLTDINFIFIQAKTSSKFDSGMMGTFGLGVKDFFSENPHMKMNEDIKAKKEIVDMIFNNSTKLKNKPNCYLYYVTTGKWENDGNCTGRISYIVDDLKELNIFNEVKFIPVDNNYLQKLYRNTIDAVECKIKFPQRVLLPDIPGIEQAYLGYIDFKSFLKLITGSNGDLLKSVFYDNVRDYQGNNPVNNEMTESAVNESKKFVVLNNGITIICRQLDNFRDEFTLTDYQIVNGCQTSHVLFENKSKISSDLNVSIKLIQTKDEDIVNKIIKATNRQTAITDEQFIALDEFHRKLEAYYQTFSGNKRIYYERRSKQYNSDPDVERVRIVTISTQIKSVASMFFDEPHLASRYYGKLLKMTENIFNEDHQLIPYYTAAFTLYRIEYLFRNRMLDLHYKKFKFFLLMMIKYDLIKENIAPLNSKKIEQQCGTILHVVENNTKLITEIVKLEKIIDANVDDISSSEATKSAKLSNDLRRQLTSR